MRIVKGYFYIITSDCYEDFEIKFKHDISDEYVNKVLKEGLNNFIKDIDQGWIIKSDEII